MANRGHFSAGRSLAALDAAGHCLYTIVVSLRLGNAATLTASARFLITNKGWGGGCPRLWVREAPLPACCQDRLGCLSEPQGGANEEALQGHGDSGQGATLEVGKAEAPRRTKGRDP